MNRLAVIGVLSFALNAVSTPVATGDTTADAFAKYVDQAGGIRVPPSYRTEWAFLGTWAVNSQEGKPRGATGFHNVYTQPKAIAAYRKTGKFPDGAVLVKELLKAKTGPMTTGTISWGDESEGWFVMIKDTKGRFEGNKLWGDGWGWALFDAQGKVITEDYKAECVGCHIPARATDWVYVQGYPPLN